MLANASKLALAGTMLALVVTGADAQGINRRCAKSKDQVRCTCFLEAGARIDPVRGPKGVRLSLYTMAQHEQLVRCMKRHGRS